MRYLKSRVWTGRCVPDPSVSAAPGVAQPRCGELPLGGGRGWRPLSGDVSSAFPRPVCLILGKYITFLVHFVRVLVGS